MRAMGGAAYQRLVARVKAHSVMEVTESAYVTQSEPAVQRWTRAIHSSGLTSLRFFLFLASLMQILPVMVLS